MISVSLSLPLFLPLSLPLPPPPDRHYGLSTDVLGHVLEVISGTPLDDFLATQVFLPLGMVDTGFSVPPQHANRLAECYDFHARLGFVKTVNPETNRLTKPTLLSGGGVVVVCMYVYV